MSDVLCLTLPDNRRSSLIRVGGSSAPSLLKWIGSAFRRTEMYIVNTTVLGHKIQHTMQPNKRKVLLFNWRSVRWVLRTSDHFCAVLCYDCMRERAKHGSTIISLNVITNTLKSMNFSFFFKSISSDITYWIPWLQLFDLVVRKIYLTESDLTTRQSWFFYIRILWWCVHICQNEPESLFWNKHLQISQVEQ